MLKQIFFVFIKTDFTNKRQKYCNNCKKQAITCLIIQVIFLLTLFKYKF